MFHQSQGLCATNSFDEPDTSSCELILALFQPGDELLPKDSHGKLIFDDVNLCSTWEVSALQRGHVSNLKGGGDGQEI